MIGSLLTGALTGDDAASWLARERMARRFSAVFSRYADRMNWLVGAEVCGRLVGPLALWTLIASFFPMKRVCMEPFMLTCKRMGRGAKVWRRTRDGVQARRRKETKWLNRRAGKQVDAAWRGEYAREDEWIRKRGRREFWDVRAALTSNTEDRGAQRTRKRKREVEARLAREAEEEAARREMRAVHEFRRWIAVRDS